MLFLQLLRRVAAALPGMESTTTDKANKDNLRIVEEEDTTQEPQPQTRGCAC